MNTAELQRSWFQQLLQHAPAGLPGEQLPWLQQARADARRALAELPVPDRRQEAWRYTAIEGLLKNQLSIANGSSPDAQLADAGAWLETDYAAYRLVFVNGRCVPHASRIDDLPRGVRLGSLRAALSTDAALLATWFGQATRHSAHLFSALNSALINDGTLLHIEKGLVLDRPIEVIHLHVDTDAEALLIQPRNLVVLEAGARATLVERFIGSGDSRYFNNSLSELVLRDDAALQHYRIQDESRSAYHLSSLYLAQQRNSSYQGTTLAFGGAWARTEYDTVFKQPGARCELSGLYTVGDRQLTDFHLNVQHSVANCTSREQFKGILYGKGRAVFDGRILVDKQAQGSDAHLSNDNLMLTRDAEVDTKPQLEIYADDVKCSHGTTVGQLDPQQLFYLRSRGIDAAAARRMLCMGYAGEIIDSIALPELREHATERLVEILGTAGGPEG